MARAVTVELRKEPPPPPMPPAGERATPENRDLASEIDTVAQLPDAALQERRTVVSNQAGRTSGPEHEKAVQSLDALEYVASMRRLGPRKLDWKNYEYIRHDAGKRRAYLRGIVEEGVRESGSFEATIKNVPRAGGKELGEDLRLLEQDAETFAAQFRRQARINAVRMLHGSQHAIADVLGSYGLPASLAMWAAQQILHGAGAEQAAREVVKEAKENAGANAPGRAKHRMRLAEWVEHLKTRQAKVNDLFKRTNQAALDVPMDGTGPKTKAHTGLKHELDVARTELATSWIEAERAHPVLAAYRGTTKELEKIDLGALDTAPVDDQMRELLEHVLPKLAHIVKAKEMIENGDIPPLALPAVVGLTRANMFVPNGSIRAGVINDLAAKASRDVEPTWMIVATIALAIVTLVPSGGTSLALATSIAGASLAAYTAIKEIKHYDEQTSLYDTDLDRARALSQEEPSMTRVAISLISLGLEGLPLIHAFKLALDIKRLKAAGDDASKLRKLIDELNKLGKEKNAPKLGEEVAEDAEKAAAKTSTPAEELPHAEVEHEWGKPPKGHKRAASTPKRLAEVMKRFKSPAHVRKAVSKRLSALNHGFDLANPPVGWDLMIEMLSMHTGGTNKELRRLLPIALAGMRDPELYAEVMAEAFARVRPGRDMGQVLLEMAAEDGSATRIIPSERGVLKADEFFEQVASQDAHWVDNPLIDGFHGSMSHLVQDIVVNKAFKRAGVQMTSPKFRVLLGGAEGKLTFQQLRASGQVGVQLGGELPSTGDLIWRLTYDSQKLGDLNRPEEFAPILQELLDVL